MAFYDKIFRPGALASSAAAPVNPSGPRIVNHDPMRSPSSPANPWKPLPRILQRLPAGAADVAAELIQQRDEAQAAWRALRDQIDATRVKCETARVRREELINGPHGQDGFQPSKPDAAIVVEQDRIISGCDGYIAKVQPRAEQMSDISTGLGQLIKNVEAYLTRVDSDFQIKAHRVTVPQLLKGETEVNAVERCRRRVRELRADHDRCLAAPIHSSVVKKAAREKIAALAERGAPDAFGAIEMGEAVHWPTTDIHLNTINADVFGHVTAPDVMPILAFLLRDVMTKAVDAAIDQAADDDAALSQADRAKLIDQCRRDALAVERDEVAYVAMSNDQGNRVAHRADIDPRALLGLADDLPAPKWQ